MLNVSRLWSKEKFIENEAHRSRNVSDRGHRQIGLMLIGEYMTKPHMLGLGRKHLQQTSRGDAQLQMR
ncbi:MAG: hypothetical protein AAGE59_11970 [Cyanobacteria bacterium P01_F01_bin.86]